MIPFLWVISTPIFARGSPTGLLRSAVYIYGGGAFISLHPFIALGLTETFLSNGDHPFYSIINPGQRDFLVPSPWLVYVVLAGLFSALLLFLSVRLCWPQAEGKRPRRVSAASPRGEWRVADRRSRIEREDRRWQLRAIFDPLLSIFRICRPRPPSIGARPAGAPRAAARARRSRPRGCCAMSPLLDRRCSALRSPRASLRARRSAPGCEPPPRVHRGLCHRAAREVLDQDRRTGQIAKLP